MSFLPLLPPLSEDQVRVGAQVGESWEEARQRLEKLRFALAPSPCLVCEQPFVHLSTENPNAICSRCDADLSSELRDA